MWTVVFAVAFALAVALNVAALMLQDDGISFQ
jgi:hypothetical protein